MKNITRFMMLPALVLSSVAFSASQIPASQKTIPTGSYSYTQQGDELIGGQKASITWNITIKNDHNAVVAISSWHAPFTCDGLYSISNKEDYASLTWSTSDNKDTECDIPSPQILLKKSPSGEIMIKSELFPWNSEDWQVVKKHIHNN